MINLKHSYVANRAATAIILCTFFPMLSACGKPATALAFSEVSKESAATNTPKVPERMLNSDEIKAKYRNCSEGYYSGPQVGKARYMKDDYLWVVSAEFAKRYCMPPEFIDPQLKGALAIAYKPVYEGRESCGFGGQKEVCGRRAAHGFEIYFDDKTQIESASDTKYNYSAFYMLDTSKQLLSQNEIEHPKYHEAWLKDRPGAQNRFKLPGWGIAVANNNKIIVPFIACREVQYIDSVLPHINFLSLECTLGMNGFSNPRLPKPEGREYWLDLAKAGDDRDDQTAQELAHYIVLPDRLVKEVERVDIKGAEAFNHLIHKALPELSSPRREQ